MDILLFPRGSSLLDVILTSTPETHIKSGVCKCAISDHDLIFTLIDINEYREQQRHVEMSFRDTRKLNTELFLDDIKSSA